MTTSRQRFFAFIALFSWFGLIAAWVTGPVQAAWIPIGGDDLLFVWVSDQEDTDGDGLSDIWELANGYKPDDASDGDADYDSDGISNSGEILAGLNPSDPGDAGLDADQDGLTNIQEFQIGTSIVRNFSITRGKVPQPRSGSGGCLSASTTIPGVWARKNSHPILSYPRLVIPGY